MGLSLTLKMEVKMTTQQKTKKQVANATTLKLFNACKINQLRKEYSKQWIEIK